MNNVSRQLLVNYQAVCQRIARACDSVGRSPNEVRLVAVTKYAQWEWVTELLKLEHVDLGENRPQQLIERADLPAQPVTWHLIGHLQTNKVRKVIPIAAWIHSIDSFKLLEMVDRVAVETGIRPKVLLEVNITGEASKDGFAPQELRGEWDRVRHMRGVELRGLMTMAPASDNPEDARPAFRALRQLRDELAAQHAAPGGLPDLSMGMTGDFEVAIQEGATLVRIGSALFKGLDEPSE